MRVYAEKLSGVEHIRNRPAGIGLGDLGTRSFAFCQMQPSDRLIANIII